jgi:hypothetical protein
MGQSRSTTLETLACQNLYLSKWGARATDIDFKLMFHDD